MPNPNFLPLREIRPSGWIETFLKTQAAGLTGHPSIHGYPFGQKFWGSPNDDTGPYAAWWPYAVFLRAVIAQYEITGDARYLNALVQHYQSTPHPMDWDRDVTGVEALVYLYQQTNDSAFLERAKDLYNRFNTKFPKHDCSLETLNSGKKITLHGVSFNEIADLAAILYSATAKEEYRQAVINEYAKVDRDQLLADGMHSCSEDLRGRDPLDSHETCDITDHTWALTYLLQMTRDGKYADRIEKIIE